jgi:uncharacterized protein (TIGR00369 family)
MHLSIHYRRLENMFSQAPIAKLTNASITVEEGRAELVIPVQQQFFHAAGALHGAIYFLALDNAAFFAANSLVRDSFVLTANFNLHLLRPIATGQINAIGTVIARSRTQIVAEAIAYNDESREIARGSGIFVTSNMALSEAIGYC